MAQSVDLNYQEMCLLQDAFCKVLKKHRFKAFTLQMLFEHRTRTQLLKDSGLLHGKIDPGSWQRCWNGMRNGNVAKNNGIFYVDGTGERTRFMYDPNAKPPVIQLPIKEVEDLLADFLRFLVHEKIMVSKDEAFRILVERSKESRFPLDPTKDKFGRFGRIVLKALRHDPKKNNIEKQVDPETNLEWYVPFGLANKPEEAKVSTEEQAVVEPAQPPAKPKSQSVKPRRSENAPDPTAGTFQVEVPEGLQGLTVSLGGVQVVVQSEGGTITVFKNVMGKWIKFTLPN